MMVWRGGGGRVQPGQGGADRDGFSGAALAGDDSDPALGDAPADAGHGFAVAGVAVQHPGCQIAAEGGAAEPEEALQTVDHADTPPLGPRSSSSCSSSSTTPPTVPL